MIDALLDFMASNQNLWGFLSLVLMAGAEYVFPPIPGDTFVLLGGVLVAARGWSPLFVIGATTLGSVGGSLLDYAAGRWLASHPESWLAQRLMRRRLGHAMQRVLAGFERHGGWYLVLNRFLPGIRAFFFVAAGMAKLSAWRVALWGGLSAVLWNLLVIAAGFALGGNLDRVKGFFAQYTLVAWVLVALVLTVVGVRFWRQERRARDARDDPGPGAA